MSCRCRRTIDVRDVAASSLFVLFSVLSPFIPITPARGDITPIGDVSPSDPSGWDSTTTGYIGNTASGTLTVDGGSDLISSDSYIGYQSGSTGVVSVSGTDSTWTNSSALYVGWFGSGMLSITSGGSVSNTRGYVGTESGATGTVTLDGIGSMWTNSDGLYVGNMGDGTLNVFNGSTVSVVGATCVGSNSTIDFGGSGGTLSTGRSSAATTQLMGKGTINTRGLVSDFDLTFDGSEIVPRCLAPAGG